MPSSGATMGTMSTTAQVRTARVTPGQRRRGLRAVTASARATVISTPTLPVATYSYAPCRRLVSRVRASPLGGGAGGGRGKQLHQRFVIHRLHQVRVEARLGRALPVLVLTPTGQGDQDHVLAPGLLANVAAHLEAVLP